ncbi:MAG TPA: hypothetical protein VFB12_29700 [Ktedonobacteraceae bacterium]|nr:hypothetical protein [Ktedonobacteraceae bacterium]
MKPMLWATWLLRCYPRAWRARYEQEMLALLEQHTVTLATLLDLLLGALEAHLDPNYRTVRPFFGFTDLRSIAITFVCAFTLAFFNMTTWTGLHPAVVGDVAGFLYTRLSDLGSVVMFLAALFSNLLVVGMLVKEVQGSRRKQLLWPAVCCLVLFFAAPLLFIGPRPTPHPLLRNPSPQLSAALLTRASQIYIAVLPFYKMIPVTIAPLQDQPSVYLGNLLHLAPFLSVLLSSLFIVLVTARKTSMKPRLPVLWITGVEVVVFSLGFYLFLGSILEPVLGLQAIVYLRPFYACLCLLVGLFMTLIIRKMMSKPRFSALWLIGLLCLIVSGFCLVVVFLLVGPVSRGLIGWIVYYGLDILPYFAWPATMVLVLLTSEVSRSKGRLALICASALALAMLLYMATQLVTLPSSLYDIQLYPHMITAWWTGSGAFLTTLTINALVTMVEVGIAIAMLIRGFIVLKTPTAPVTPQAGQTLTQRVQE